MPYYNPYKSFNFRTRFEGNNYHVRNRAGVRKYGSGYPEAATKEMVDSLKNNRTEMETAKLDLASDRRSKTTHHSLGYPAGNVNCIDLHDYTVLEIQGKITLANNTNKNMIGNSDVTNGNDYIAILGVCGQTFLDGNNTQQTSGHIMDFTASTGNPEHITVEGITARLAKNMALRLYRVNQFRGSDLNLHGSDYGLYMMYVYDSEIQHVLPVGSSEDAYPAVYLRGHQNRLSHFYVNNGMEFSSVEGTTLDDIYFDNKPSVKDRDCLVLAEVTNSQFSNLRFNIQENAGITTKDAIKIQSNNGQHSFDNEFINIKSGRWYNEGSNNWKYTIEEVDANQDWNSYSNVNGRGNATGALRVLGADSKLGGGIKGKVAIA